jgi:hypothetical protein
MKLRRVRAAAPVALMLACGGCILIELVLLPFQLIFGLFGAAGGAVGIAQVEPPDATPPVVRQVDPEHWAVTGLREDVRCEIVCSAPGFEPRTYSWPRDFYNHGEDVEVRLERSR